MHRRSRLKVDKLRRRVQMGRWKSRLPFERYYGDIHAIDTRRMDDVISTHVYPTVCFGTHRCIMFWRGLHRWRTDLSICSIFYFLSNLLYTLNAACLQPPGKPCCGSVRRGHKAAMRYKNLRTSLGSSDLLLLAISGLLFMNLRAIYCVSKRI